jgi:F-type H+-transporting ATPase subunit delta
LTGNIVARRYAKALFALGKGKGAAELDAYGKDLAALAEVLAQAPEAVKVFKNPIFTAQEKKGVLEGLLAKMQVGPMVKNFLSLLADKNRLAFLTDINAYFGTLLDEVQGVVRGELVTAVPLSAAKQAEVKATLEKQTGRKLVLDFSADGSILGGVVLKIGDKVLDASLRAQIQMLKDQIKRGE